MQKKLSKEAYGGIHGSKYQPYVTNGESLKQITPTVLLFGVILSIIFAASNAYSGSISGLTVAAGIPGAILGSGFMAVFVKKSNVLNVNVLQGMSSGGEAIASGMIYLLPAFFILSLHVTFVVAVLAGITGLLLGIGFTSIFYNYLIIEEHGELIYPESLAISETLVSSDAKGDGLKVMGYGAGFGSLLTLVSTQFLGLFNTTFALAGSKFKWQWMTEANPLLLGIGFIVGLEVALAMFAGSILANFVIIPLIAEFTTHADPSFVAWNDANMQVVNMTAADIQNIYTKYIGAGMMLAGGFIGAIKLIPVIWKSLKETFAPRKNIENVNSSKMNLNIILIILGLMMSVVISVIYSTNISMIFLSIVLIILFSLVFSIVSSRMTGDIGTSNLPVSGMTIAALLVVTVSFVACGQISGNDIWTNKVGNAAILLIGTAIVTSISVAAGYAQTQKVTYIIGGSKDQIQKIYILAAIIGVLTTVLVIFLIAPEAQTNSQILPQANLMATLTNGILTGNLPWAIIFVGIFMAVVFYFLDLPIMTVALGFYLSMATVTIILIGALLRVIIKKVNSKNKEQRELKEEKGIIYSSGLVAGGALTGLVGAVFAVIAGGQIYNSPIFLGASKGANAGAAMFSGNLSAILLILVLVLVSFFFVNKKVKKDHE